MTQTHSRSNGLSVRYGKTWSSDVAGLLDYRLDNGTLAVALDYAAVRAARKDQSVTTCTWALDGRLYATSMVTVVPARNEMLVLAKEAKGDGGHAARRPARVRGHGTHGG